MDVKMFAKGNGGKMIRGINILLYESKGKKAGLHSQSTLPERPAHQDTMNSRHRPVPQHLTSEIHSALQYLPQSIDD